ncbi:type II secretion system minor pseudopilin GspJ [Sphingosinicella sp. YJ22]|uniref:type II secretion system minor pseudopilin GspJ n=1 Tax=Sphingosinicella sp. YJ22 TaxID=1104780 RepID=UPI0014079F30|nr:type II secretion system minor pseudopilin GspJ [Sphingosinicella sp. YJ22]
MTARPPRTAGFTLVEMLIALAIFGMITAGSVALLSFSVRAQDMADRQLASLGAIRRAGTLLGADFAQAVPRPWRDENGQPQRSFYGTGGQETRLFVLVRGGWDNPDALARSSLQRVEYRLQAGRIYRIGFAHVDGGGAASVASLIDEVQGVALRYRDREGAWQESWDRPDPRELPVAVEMIVTSARFGAVRQLFLVGSGP